MMGFFCILCAEVIAVLHTEEKNDIDRHKDTTKQKGLHNNKEN